MSHYPYVVTGSDICTQGFERLRNQDEFILAIPVTRHDAEQGVDALIEQLFSDIQSCARPDNFDFDAARLCVSTYIRANWNYLARQLTELDDVQEEQEPGCYLFLFISTVG